MITILDVAKARGVKADEQGGITSAEFERVGLAILGGCQCCEATIAAYNAHPSRTGYWRCADCCDERLGFATVAEFERWCVSQRDSEGES